MSTASLLHAQYFRPIGIFYFQISSATHGSGDVRTALFFAYCVVESFFVVVAHLQASHSLIRIRLRGMKVCATYLKGVFIFAAVAWLS